MNKVIALLAALVTAVSFCGCSSSKTVEQKKEIVVWHWMTDREEAFNELAARYEKEKQIKVNFELYAPSDAYSQKIRAAAQANTLPDIFGILGETRDFASFVKSAHVLDISAYMGADNGSWKNKLFAKALSMNEFLPDNHFGVQPGIYGVPIDVMNIQMLYNKDLFKKAGLDPNKPPRTWADFIEMCKKLKEAGIPGLVSGWGEIWLIDSFANDFAWNIMGQAKILATIKGEVKYTDPDWIRVFGLFKEMRDNDCLAQGTITMVNKQAEQTFANGRAAFSFNGSWCVNVYNSMNPNLNYGVFMPPYVSDKYPMVIWGGAGSSFMVNANSAVKEDAVEFLKWLTDKDQQAYLAEATRNLPANKEALSKITPILKEFADKMDNTIHPALLPATEESRVIEAFDKGIQSILIGEKTPEEVAQEVQLVKDRVTKKE